jgi:polyisoprenoid-binding protein YceI
MALFRRNRTARPDATTTVAPKRAELPSADELAGRWTLDPAHTRIGFSTKHAMVTTVRGQFNDFDGTAQIDASDPAASSASVTIKAASIDTHSADRDGHLRSADFFEVETYPEITFISTDVSRVDASTWRVTGDLTIKDVTKPVTIDFEASGTARDPFGNLRAGFEGSATINRKDWNLSWNAALETGGVLVSEKVKLEFEVSAIAVATQDA